MNLLRTDVIYPIKLEYFMSKGDTPFVITCNNFNDLLMNYKMLRVQGYILDASDYEIKEWGERETWVYGNYRYEINVKEMSANLYSLNEKLGLVATYNFNDKSDSSGWSYRVVNNSLKVLPQYLYWVDRRLAELFKNIITEQNIVVN